MMPSRERSLSWQAWLSTAYITCASDQPACTDALAFFLPYAATKSSETFLTSGCVEANVSTGPAIYALASSALAAGDASSAGSNVGLSPAIGTFRPDAAATPASD